MQPHFHQKSRTHRRLEFENKLYAIIFLRREFFPFFSLNSKLEVEQAQIVKFWTFQVKKSTFVLNRTLNKEAIASSKQGGFSVKPSVLSSHKMSDFDSHELWKLSTTPFHYWWVARKIASFYFLLAFFLLLLLKCISFKSKNNKNLWVLYLSLILNILLLHIRVWLKCSQIAKI